MGECEPDQRMSGSPPLVQGHHCLCDLEGSKPSPNGLFGEKSE
jgi:hypothetical protein